VHNTNAVNVHPYT